MTDVRVLWLLRDGRRGGLQYRAMELAGLEGCDSTVVLLNSPVETRPKGLNTTVVSFGRVRGGKRLNRILKMAKLRRLVRTERFDILFAFGYTVGLDALVATCMLQRPKMILGARNSLVEFGPSVRGSVRREIATTAARRMDAVAAISEALAAELASVGCCNVHVIPNGIAPAPIDLSTEPPHEWLRRPRSYTTIVAVGRLVPQKDFRLLLSALSHLADPWSWRAIIVGTGPEESALRLMAQSCEVAVDFVGWVGQPQEYVAHADVFALTSRYEGFGSVIVEAMNQQVPVVAVDCPSGPREILDDGAAGLLVEDRSPAKVAAALRSTREDRAATARRTEYAFARCRQRYSFEAMMCGYHRLLRHVVGDSA